LQISGTPSHTARATYERWTSKTALDAHMTTPDIKEVVPKLQPILAKPVSQIFLDGRTGV
jgi:quinol monooxygenase YgiN